MDQHAVPQNITGFQFRLVGEMTLQQFAYLVAGSIAAAIFYNTGLPTVLKITLGFISFGIGFCFAFIPIEERPLDRWLINFLKAVYNPTQFIWKKGQKIQKIDLSKLTYSSPVAPQKNQGKKLIDYLQTLPKSEESANIDDLENKKLQEISTLLGSTKPTPAPTLQPQISLQSPQNPFTRRSPANGVGEDGPISQSSTTDTILKTPVPVQTVLSTPPNLPPLKIRPLGQQELPKPPTPVYSAPQPPKPQNPPIAPTPFTRQSLGEGGPTPPSSPSILPTPPPQYSRPLDKPILPPTQPTIPPPPIPFRPQAPVNRVVIPNIPTEELKNLNTEEIEKLQSELDRLNKEKEDLKGLNQAYQQQLGEQKQQLENEQKKQNLTIEELMSLRTQSQQQKEELAKKEQNRLENNITQASSNNQDLIIQIDNLKRQLAETQNKMNSEGLAGDEAKRLITQLQRDLQQAQIDKEISAQELTRLRTEQHKMTVAPLKPVAPAPEDDTPRVRFASPKKAKEAGIPVITTVPNAINGIVMDNSGSLLPNVIVIIKDSAEKPLRALKTNRLGQFLAATPLPDGPYTIVLEKEGLEFDIIELSLKGTPVAPIEIRAK